jgi:hypothetical protein
MDRAHFIRRTVAFPLLVAAVGCSEAEPPPPADLSKAPWLDPVEQAKGLNDADMRIRGLSAVNLGNIGGAAEGALPELEKLAKNDPEPNVRESALKAIEKIKAAKGQ